MATTQIADSNMADNADLIAMSTGLNLTGAVELALDLWLGEMSGSTDQLQHMAARIARLDGVPPHDGSLE
jgi:hypothetical protein